MKTYEYKGFSREGRACKGLVEALSMKDAREKLIKEGVLAERVSLTGQKLKFPITVRTAFYRELSTLLSAGLPMVRALDVLIQSPDVQVSHVLLAGIRDRIREGVSLADALGEASGSITDFEVAIVEAAEQSAEVEFMLDRLAMFLEDQEKIKDRIQGAFIYPAIVVTVGICVAILMLTFLMPLAKELVGEKGSMPALTSFMIAFGGFLFKWGWVVILLLVSGVSYLRLKLKNDPEFKCSWAKNMFRLPIVGKGLAFLVNMRFSRTLAILLRGGVSLVDAIALAGKATGNPWVRKLAEKESEEIKHGCSLSEAIRRIPPFAGTLPGLIQVGEASGELEKMLDNAGKQSQRHWDRYIDRSLRFMEPILIFLIGCFVLAITLSILLPILSISQGVGK